LLFCVFYRRQTRSCFLRKGPAGSWGGGGRRRASPRHNTPRLSRLRSRSRIAASRSRLDRAPRRGPAAHSSFNRPSRSRSRPWRHGVGSPSRRLESMVCDQRRVNYHGTVERISPPMLCFIAARFDLAKVKAEYGRAPRSQHRHLWPKTILALIATDIARPSIRR